MGLGLVEGLENVVCPHFSWYVGLKGTGSAGAGPVGVEASGTVQFYPPGYQGSVSGSSSTAGYATPGLSGQVGIGR